MAAGGGLGGPAGHRTRHPGVCPYDRHAQAVQRPSQLPQHQGQHSRREGRSRVQPGRSAQLTGAAAALDAGEGRCALAHCVLGALEGAALVAERAAGGIGDEDRQCMAGNMAISYNCHSSCTTQNAPQLTHSSSRHDHSPAVQVSLGGVGGGLDEQMGWSSVRAVGLHHLSLPHHTE